MPLRQLFFIEGKLIAEAPRTGFFRHAELAEPLSGIWFCQHCGEVYAKAPVLRPNGTVTPWQSHRATCRKCSSKALYNSEVPGSIWLPWDHEFLDALPPPVLLWELQRHLDKAEGVP